MRALTQLLCLVWLLLRCTASAQEPERGAADAPDASVAAEPSAHESPAATSAPRPAASPPLQVEAPLRVPYEPGTSYRWPVTPPPVGACLGGNCQNLPSAAEYARARPQASPMPPGPRARTVPRRQRFAYTGAVLGSSSAALVLGGSIGIALANDIPSERVSRGVWLGYVAVATPLVAMSSWLASRESGYQGFKAVRRVGWLAYGLAVSDGALLWSSAFRHVYSPRLLTIGAGVFGVFALLPHALDALNAARSLRSKRLQQRLHVTGTGLLLRF